MTTSEIDATAGVLRDPFQASAAARVERDQIKALSQQVDSYDGVELEDDMDSIEPALLRLLGADDRELWMSVPAERRMIIVQRAHKRSLLAAERNFQRALRQDTCGLYIDLLCQLINTPRREVGEEVYEELSIRYRQAKADWEAISRAPKPKHQARDTSSATTTESTTAETAKASTAADLIEASSAEDLVSAQG
jgi:hypothetical protein